MKTALLIAALLCSIAGFGQETKPRYNWKHAIAPAALSFTAGATWATHETIMHHYPNFQKVFPNADPQWWNPAISWENKYRSDVPIWFSDAKHLLATTTQVAIFSAGITITLGRRRPAWHYLVDIGISGASYTLGNVLMYDVVFKN